MCQHGECLGSEDSPSESHFEDGRAEDRKTDKVKQLRSLVGNTVPLWQLRQVRMRVSPFARDRMLPGARTHRGQMCACPPSCESCRSHPQVKMSGMKSHIPKIRSLLALGFSGCVIPCEGQMAEEEDAKESAKRLGVGAKACRLQQWHTASRSRKRGFIRSGGVE